MPPSSNEPPQPSSDDAEVRRQFDWAETPPSTAVVRTIASASDVETTAVTPLYERIDPDSLDVLIESSWNGTSAGAVTASFTFSGYQVTIHASGDVVVHPAHDAGQSTR
jgi:hypothetical protein